MIRSGLKATWAGAIDHALSMGMRIPSKKTAKRLKLNSIVCWTSTTNSLNPLEAYNNLGEKVEKHELLEIVLVSENETECDQEISYRFGDSGTVSNFKIKDDVMNEAKYKINQQVFIWYEDRILDTHISSIEYTKTLNKHDKGENVHYRMQYPIILDFSKDAPPLHQQKQELLKIHEDDVFDKQNDLIKHKISEIKSKKLKK